MLADLTLKQESFQRSWGEGCSYRTIAKKISPCTPPFRRWCIMYMRCQTWVLHRRRLYKHKLNKSCPNFNFFCYICIFKFKTKNRTGTGRFGWSLKTFRAKWLQYTKLLKSSKWKGGYTHREHPTSGLHMFRPNPICQFSAIMCVCVHGGGGGVCSMQKLPLYFCKLLLQVWLKPAMLLHTGLNAKLILDLYL